MTPNNLRDREDKLMEELVRLRKLGAFDVHAGVNLLLTENLFELYRHIREASEPQTKPSRSKK